MASELGLIEDNTNLDCVMKTSRTDASGLKSVVDCAVIFLRDGMVSGEATEQRLISIQSDGEGEVGRTSSRWSQGAAEIGVKRSFMLRVRSAIP